MEKALVGEALLKFAAGLLLAGILIFLPAGTVNFWNGWLLMGILFVPMFCAGLVMMKKAPDLLKKRLEGKEKQKGQSLIVKASGCMFIAGFAAAGLNYRFGWHMLPEAVSLGAVGVFLLAYLMYARVLWENRYLSRTIRVQKDQKVIDTGLYALVRHPMYSATLLLFLSMPLVLGSLQAFCIFLVYPVLIAARIRKEERFLEENLPGYREYEKKVKYRLIPFVW